MIGGVSRHMLPHLSGVPHRLIVNNNANDFNFIHFLFTSFSNTMNS